ncbi:MAG: HAD family hydrolase [Alphaproteobacteria bacterium]|nr:HAD family hydrolase [Alphaproteobacteria bacterium]
MKPLAVFDWNGTLFDDLEANLAGANAVVEMFGLPALTAEQYQDHFTFPILHFYVSLGIGTVEYLARHEEAAQRFLSVYEETALRCSLRDGAEDVLAWLNEHDVHRGGPKKLDRCVRWIPNSRCGNRAGRSMLLRKGRAVGKQKTKGRSPMC